MRGLPIALIGVLLLADVACLSSLDVPLKIFFQKKTLLKELLRCVRDVFYVDIVRGVPLFDR